MNRPSLFARIHALKVACLGFLVMVIAPAHANFFVVDNIGKSSGFGAGLANPGDANANAFTPNKTGFLRSVTVNLSAFEGTPSVAEVRLWSGSGNRPQTQIGVIGQTPAFSSDGVDITVEVTSTADRHVLEAGTRYWITVHNVSGDFDWNLTTSEGNTGAAFGTILDVLAESDNGTAWSAAGVSGEYHLMRVTADEHLVFNTEDSGIGSLREAIATAGDGEVITFDAVLSGQTITLTSGELMIDQNLTIDASGLNDGISISGNNVRRAMTISAGRTVVLDSLTIRDGVANTDGGGILNFGTLTVNHSTIHNNVADLDGGGIFSEGILTLNNSTVWNNGRSDPDTRGGGIFADTIIINNSTITQNSAGEAAGIRASNATIHNSIVAGNIPSDLEPLPPLAGGNNLIGGDPMLGPLADHGGATQTMLPLAGSPAIDGGGPSVLATDQRGFARTVGSAPDIGAAELQERIVTTDNDIDDGPFVTEQNGISLREAINYAQPGEGEIIRFAPSLSGQTIYLTREEPLVIDRDVIIDGSTLPQSVVISGDADESGDFTGRDTRVFEIEEGSNAALQALTISGGYVLTTEQFGWGAGVFNAGSLVIDRCTIHGNRVQTVSEIQFAKALGAGVANLGSTTIRNATIANNETEVTSSNPARESAGAGLYAAGPFTIIHTTLTNNRSLNNGSLNLAPGIDAVSPGEVSIVNSMVEGGFTLDGFTVTTESDLATNSLLGEASLVRPLGDYGGPLLTAPLRPASITAVDRGIATGLATDQRGFTRVVGAAPDIGAAELQEILVDTEVDEDDGIGVGGISLRDAIKHDVPGEAEMIRFDPSLDGKTIALNSQLVIERAVAIDGSPLSRALTINLQQSAALDITEGDVLLDSLRIADGQSGGVVLERGSLYLRRCAIQNNSGGILAGGIWDLGGSHLIIDQSTISGNETTRAIGGILVGVNSTARISRSTIVGNSGPSGGGILNNGNLTIEDSTISANIGVGIVNDPSQTVDAATVTLRNSIVAGNFPIDGDQIVAEGERVTSVLESLSFVAEDPELTPLGDYGGPTPTMLPLPGSPVVNAGGTSTFTVDQRGEPRLDDGGLDIGATEYQGGSDFTRLLSTDWDGDGRVFALERALGTDPLTADSDDPRRVTVSDTADGVVITFGLPDDLDVIGDTTYILKRSTTDLKPGSFIEIIRIDGFGITTELESIEVIADAQAATVTDTSLASDSNAFYVLQVETTP